MYNNKLYPLNREIPKKDKKNNLFHSIKCKTQKCYSSLNEVENFLSKASFSHKILKLYSILK